MKQLKRILCLILAAATIFSLGANAFAANAAVSTHKLTVDGVVCDCVAFNIAGNNYFKLRDIASLLKGSATPFDVSYDSTSNTVAITTGKAYTAVGGELTPVTSAQTAVSSKQTISIDGRKNDAMTVYNIAGNNYFKLRDLGNALHFFVDYDANSKTILIQTKTGETPVYFAVSSPTMDGEIEVQEVLSPFENKVVFTGEYGEIQAFFQKQNWSDGLPITPPTTAKLNKFLQFTPYKADDKIMGENTTYNVAINAIMAGCHPQFMPLCIAITKALGNQAVIEALTGKNAATAYAWLNGPVARQLGFDFDQGAISDADSKVLARFINLALMNMAGVDVSHTQSTFGSIEPFVFAEDEQSCKTLGWEPYHVSQNYAWNDSTITFSTATSWGNNLTPACPEYPEQIMQLMAYDITEKDDSALGGTNTNSRRTIFITANVAENLATTYKTKGALEDALIEAAREPAKLHAYSVYWANDEVNYSQQYPTFEAFYEYYKTLNAENLAITATPKWYFTTIDSKKIYTTSAMKKGETQILVLGDNSRNKTQTISGGQCFTVKIELPKNWDALLDVQNQDPKTFFYYEPISNFYLGNDKTNIPPTQNEKKEQEGSTGSEKYAFYEVMSPVGYNAVEMITQADRLKTLKGAKIAFVGRSFSAPVTQAVLQEMLVKEYGIQVFTIDDVGFGGSYSVFNPTQQTKEFQKKLQELGIDAVVSGNCGCGLCTVKETGSSIAAEYVGIPTVTIGATGFIHEIQSTGVNRGVPVIRTVAYDGAFTSDSTETLQRKTREELYPALVKALTTPITQEEIAALKPDAQMPYDKPIVWGTYDMIQEHFKMMQWSDGLPIVPPTAERVKEYLKYTPYAPSTVLGVYPVAYRETTVYTVAVNAVMAGVPVEYMPLCVAFVQSMDGPEWRKTLSSTHGWSPYAWLNGPVARQLGFGSDTGMMNEENNRKFARFIELAMLNIGGYYIKENRMGTFGYLTPWVFAEDDAAALEIGWKPYHMTKGMNLNDNTLTSASALYWGPALTPQTDDAKQIANIVALDATQKHQNALGNTNPHVFRTMYITKDVAQILSGTYASKSDFESALVETAREPLWLRTYSNYWAHTSGQQHTLRSFKDHYLRLMNTAEENAKVTARPVWYDGILDAATLYTIPNMKKGETPILVTGNDVGRKVQFLPGGGYQTVKIALPENWDALMAKLGYAPLRSFYLEDTNKQEDSAFTLADGSYKIMPNATQITASGRIFADGAAGTVTYFSAAAGEVKTTSNQALATLLAALGTGSSIYVENGAITRYVLRPAVTKQGTEKDISKFDSAMFQGASVLIDAASDNTSANAAIILPDTLTKVQLTIDRKNVSVVENTAGLLNMRGSNVTINKDAPVGSTAVVGSGANTLTIIKGTGTYKVIYNYNK